MPDIGAALQVRVDAAAGEMRGGHDGDRFAGDVDALREAALVNAGKTFADKVRPQRGQVEVGTGLAVLGEVLLDRAGGDVAGRQRTERMHALHELPAVAVDQHRALAPQGFRDEERRGAPLEEHRRMKLHVFQVDQARAHAVRHRDAVADTAGLVG